MKTGIQSALTCLFISGLMFVSGVLSPVNGQPVLSGIETTMLQYTAGDPAIQVTNTIRVEGRNLISATISISLGYVAGRDRLNFSDTKDIISSWNEKTGVLTLSGSVSANAYRDALRKVYFESSAGGGSSPGIRIISFSISSWFSKSNTVSRSINVSAANNPPLLGNVATDPVVYCMDSEGEVISNTITISDPDNENLSSAVVAITLGYTENIDVLLFSDQNGISGSWNSSTGQLTLSGESSVANYQEALRTVGYRNTNSENPHAGFHEITFSVNDGKAWSNPVVGRISHLVPTAVIEGDFSICRDALAVLEINFTGSAPWSFSYTRNSGNEIVYNNISANPYSLTVSDPGTYSLVSVNDRYCPGKTSGTAVVSLLPEPDVHITGLKSAYSRESTEMIPLTAEPAGGVFSGQGVIPYGQGWFFLPSLPPPGITYIVYKYRPDESSCYGYDTVAVRILEKSAAIEIEDNRTKFCSNDKPFRITGINLLNNSYGVFSITGGKGLIDHGNNTATIYPDSLQVNVYTLFYTPPDGYTTDLDIEIGSPLLADFKWDNECIESGSAVNFLNTSSSTFGFLTDDSYRWSVGLESDTIQFVTENISYEFPETGNYEVKLRITNSNGCVNETSKIFPLRPVYALAGNNYGDDFEDKQEWESGYDPSAGSDSWVLGKPDMLINGFSHPHSGEKCWFTNIEINPVPREKSWITSPCFNFTGTDKPTLVARIRRSFTDSRDGANISYTTDNGAHWNLIGGLNDGINWFNGYFGNPGAQSHGWTAIKDNDWVETRHVLDFLKGEDLVQFRVNYLAGGSAIGNKGLALDDIRIVERNRTIIVEHFTNTSSEAYEADDLLGNIARIAGSGLIDVHFHTSDPLDPFYLYNPELSVARQFYYGLTQSPYSVINGGMQENQHIDYENTFPTPSQVGIESLYDSDFDLKVTSMIEGDRFYAEVVITALHDVPLSELSVRMVVFEPLVIDSTITEGRSAFRNVVRAMLPDAAGNSIYSNWQKDQSHRIVEGWDIGNVYNKNGLRVAVFLQNEMTREIQQAAIDQSGLINAADHPITGMRSMLSAYPNPADHILHIEFADPGEEYLIEIVNISGITVYGRTVSNRHTISLRNIPAGIYVVRSADAHGRTEMHKIMVTH